MTRARDERALERRILAALDKSRGMTVEALCKPAFAPSRVVRRALERLSVQGHVREYRPGLWCATRRLGRLGGVGRRGALCACQGYGKRAYDDDGRPEWRCGRCDRRWPRATPPEPSKKVLLDPVLRDFGRAIRVQSNRGCARFFFGLDHAPKEMIPMKPRPATPGSGLHKIEQHDLALQAVRHAPRDEHGFTTTGEAWKAYLAIQIPPPYLHVGERHFRGLLRDLGTRGRLELHLVSRGAHGQTTYIREKPQQPAAQAPDAPAES